MAKNDKVSVAKNTDETTKVVNLENGQPKTDETANDTTPAPETVPEPEQFVSDALTALRAKESDLEDQLDKVGNKTPEGKKIRLELYMVGTSIENEITLIKKAKIAAENDAKQKKIITDFWGMFDLRDEFKVAEASFEAIPVENRELPENAEIKAMYNDLNTMLKNVTEPIINRLLGSIPKGVTAGTTGTTGATGGKGKSAEIRELIAPLYATMSPAQVRAFIIKDKGFNDGTANAAIHAYECENSLNGKNPTMLEK